MPQKQTWALLPTQCRHQIRKGHPVPLCPYSNDPHEIARLLLASPATFDVWSVEEKGRDVVASGLVVAAYPGQGPEEWYPHKYTPVPSELVLVQRNIPVGELDATHLPGKGLSKSVNVSKNEIESALIESDLYARDVSDAMNLLPDVDALYAFLKEKGQHKTINLIRRLLSY